MKFELKRETRGRKRITTARQAQNIIYLVEQNPKITSTKIKQDLSLTASTVTISSYLKQSNLKTRTPLLGSATSKKNMCLPKNVSISFCKNGALSFGLFGSGGTHYCQKAATNSLRASVYFTDCEAWLSKYQYLGLFLKL